MSPSWLRPTANHDNPPPPPHTPSQSPSTLSSGDPNLTTCIYQTDHGVFYLTWSRTFLGGHSVNLFLHSQDYYNHSSPLSFSTADLSLSSAVSFHLNLNTLLAFWKKRGSRYVSPKIQVLWDLTKAKFDSGSEPRSGFYIAVVVDGEMGLLVGDSVKEAYARAKSVKPPTNPQALLLRKEHVFGARVFTTKARFGGKNREICIDCRIDEDAKLCFSVDSKQVLQIKRLRWKFRGNEKVEIDGVNVQISWDVYNWLFQSKNSGDGGGHAVFMFRFENDPEAEEACIEREEEDEERNRNSIVLWKPKQCGGSSLLGIKGIVEWRKMMRKRFVKSKRSSASSSMSMSSASSACSSSVMEWASSVDETEYGGGGSSGSGSGNGLGFSLLVYAWIK